MIDAGVLRAQYALDHAIAPSPAGLDGLDGLDDMLAWCHVERNGLALMAIGISA